MDYQNYLFAPEDNNTLIQYRYYSKGDDSERNKFNSWFLKLKQDGPARIAEEFAQLTKTLGEQRNPAEAWKKNAEYNRYQDMLCFDSTRIPLRDGLQPDYIHANYISGFHRQNAYVLTQGPLPNTVVDFWRMVWQENIATVVMVTRLEERGKPKCARYFPENSEKPFMAGMFRVSLKAIDKRHFCCATLLEVVNTLNQSVRHVAHVWYITWPDQGVPEDLESLRHFLNFAKVINLTVSLKFYSKEQQQQEHNKRGQPMLFHCSAGIGRSAVLVVLDMITELMTHNYHFDVLELVKKMRQERFHVIHTEIQLLFVYHYCVVLACHERFMWLKKETPEKAATQSVVVRPH